jgi:hypothetical protein
MRGDPRMTYFPGEKELLAENERLNRTNSDQTHELDWLRTEVERLQAAIAWTREVHPGKNPESGGAIVHMTWDQFNTMRALTRIALERKP